jgi:uncharacterized SAM-binding protein YcdF (DUF218 family)
MQTMYFARHAVDALVDPLVVALLLGLLAALLWLRGRRVAGGWLLLSAGVVVYVFSLVPVGDLMLLPLERQYPSLGARAQLPAVRYVVILGSSYLPRADVSPASALDCEGLVRVVEGVRMVRRLPGVRLIVSGGAPAGREPVAHGYAKLARDLGIDETSITVLDTPLNTDAEARSIAAALGSQPFLLVTSAWHMPRAMRLMTRVHAEALAMPTGQQTGAACRFWTCFLPSSAGLHKSELAIHEYRGLAALAVNLE